MLFTHKTQTEGKLDELALKSKIKSTYLQYIKV